MPNPNLEFYHTYQKQTGKWFFLMWKPGNIWAPLLLFSVVLLLAGCGDDDSARYKQATCVDKNFDGNCFPKPDSSKVITKAPHVSVINVFVETSGSMAGYMPVTDSATEFQQIIPEIVSSLNTTYPGSVHFYSIYSSSDPFRSLTVDESRKSILHGQFDWSGSTYLPLMLDTVMVKYLKENAVNIFVSDCIYSPEKKDSKTTSLALTDIRDQTIPFTKDYGTLLVSLKSRYVGKAVTAKSPYYMVIQGKPENLTAVKNNVLTSFDRLKQEHREIDFEHPLRNPAYSALPYTDKSPNFSAEPAATFNGADVKLDKIDLSQKSEISFWVGLDLSKLPVFARDSGYIRQNISCSVDQGTAKVTDVRSSSPAQNNQDDKEMAAKYTHFVKISLTELNGDVGALKLSLKYTRPQWVENLNEKDPAKEDVRTKTFGLEKIVSGFEEAYGMDKTYFFFDNLTFSLIKK